jgi:hypothetical protein
MSRLSNTLSSSWRARTWLGERLQEGHDGYWCLAGSGKPARRRLTPRSSRDGRGPIRDPQLLGAQSAPTASSAGLGIDARLRWLAALPAGAETAREVVVMRHCAMTWTLGSQHTWCTDITLSECGGFAVRLGGQRVASRRYAQRTRPPVGAAEGCELVGYRQAADACGECADCGRDGHLGGAAGHIRDRFGWVTG